MTCEFLKMKEISFSQRFSMTQVSMYLFQIFSIECGTRQVEKEGNPVIPFTYLFKRNARFSLHGITEVLICTFVSTHSVHLPNSLFSAYLQARICLYTSTYNIHNAMPRISL